jgi:succinoglycan biosynthesis protein ExoA
MPTNPTISAVMAARDDAAHLGAAVASVLAQDIDGELELVIAVGPSDDDTAAVAERLAAEDPRVRVVSNPSGGTAAGLNRAIAVAAAPVLARVDAHCELPPGYLRRALHTLATSGAANVGGVQAAEGDTAFGRAVAAAMSSRFGVGDARFHYGGEPGPVDTVYLGVFDAAALRAVGGYDETLVRNQDYELNWRLREHGHIVWFDPELVVRYRPRDRASRLARQYFQYGQWKREVLRRHPRSVRARQLVAPVTVLGIVGGLVGAAAGRRWMLGAPIGYGAAVLAAAAGTSTVGPAERVRLAAVFPTMHLSWGVGFLAGPPGRGRRSPEGVVS